MGRCGSLWIVVGRCGSLWVVPGFSNYAARPRGHFTVDTVLLSAKKV